MNEAAPLYAQGAFQYETIDGARGMRSVRFKGYELQSFSLVIYDHIPQDTDTLITHTPPFMTLDTTKRGKQVGCEVLSGKLAQLRSCRLHVFGHIHECAGTQISTGDPSRLVDKVSVNAAMAVTKQAVVVDLRNYHTPCITDIMYT